MTDQNILNRLELGQAIIQLETATRLAHTSVMHPEEAGLEQMRFHALDLLANAKLVIRAYHRWVEFPAYQPTGDQPWLRK